VILVNMQYSPRTETMIAVQAYADAMHSVAQQQDVPLFDRLAAMKHWNENGTFDLSSRDRSRLAETVHDCLGRALAALIVESGSLDRKQPKENP
jgi:signal transduction histidine kinase